MANRPDWIEAVFRVALAGAVRVPVSTFVEADERSYILRHGDASILFVQESLLKHQYLDELLSQFPELAAGPGEIRCPALPELRRVVCLESDATPGVEPWEQFLAGGDGVGEGLLDALVAEVYPSDDGILIYTFGYDRAPERRHEPAAHACTAELARRRSPPCPPGRQDLDAIPLLLGGRHRARARSDLAFGATSRSERRSCCRSGSMPREHLR